MPEHQNIEYKESWRDEYLKWVCGFANANGGRIYIGKNDKGKVVGVKDYKRLVDDFIQRIRRQPAPRIFTLSYKDLMRSIENQFRKTQMKIEVFSSTEDYN